MAHTLGLIGLGKMGGNMRERLRRGGETHTFQYLRQRLEAPRAFVQEALDVQAKRLAKTPLKPLSGTYPVDRQRELGLGCHRRASGPLARHAGVSHQQPHAWPFDA